MDHLAPDGLILLGDISFPDREALSQVEQRYQAVWDEEETYWCASEMIPKL